MSAKAKYWGLGALLAIVGIAAYWPTLSSMVATWSREPDYSHGFLVLPVALYFLYARRAMRPESIAGPAWGGLSLIVLSIAVRLASGFLYVPALDGWSLPLWVGGSIWLLGGRRLFYWTLPAVVFLWFMVPLPWHAEHLLSRPLQRIATSVSCWILQSIGQPALAEGNIIYLGEHHLEVEQACSGLRMFMGFFALSVAFVFLARRPLWQNVVVLASVAPIAILSNALRIVITGLLFQYSSDELAMRFSHDAAGWVMILIATGMLGLLLFYLNRVVIEVEAVETRSLARQRRPAT